MGKGKGIDRSHGKEKGQPVGYPLIMRLSISLDLGPWSSCGLVVEAWNGLLDRWKWS
jgi:hypothetical protein